MENQKFEIEIDGILKEATVLKVVNIDDRKYVVYTVDSSIENADVYASEVIKDQEGYDKLIDIEDPKIRQNIFEIVNIIFS
ncbi:MAG: DUF1292 domain-containing protein [Bacilli bacterium]|jgi:hypothetical protein|nr:DUF1292 domain-containing protein [Bacilli bacterium]CCZ59927.1 unknown [Clostridium sp. CAG:710]